MNPREQVRRERARLYASAAWKALRKQHLQRQPLCVHCGRRGTVVDHVRGHMGNWRDRFFDASGLQTLCWSCHSSKTAGAESTANGARTLQLRALGRVARGGGSVPSYSEATLSTRTGTARDTAASKPSARDQLAARLIQRMKERKPSDA
jgi:hypothetical protein